MEDPKNFVNQPELNAFNDYYSQTDSNYDPNREKNITNKAKETIKNFKNQYLMTNDNNQRILPTEINQNQNAQNYSYQILPMSNKVREDKKEDKKEEKEEKKKNKKDEDSFKLLKDDDDDEEEEDEEDEREKIKENILILASL